MKLIDFYLLFWRAQRGLLAVLGAQLRLENLALRQQLMVLRRSAPKRLKLTPPTEYFGWVCLRRLRSDWKSALMIVKAETVIGWHLRVFAYFGHGESAVASRVGPACRERFEI